ncbi:hypothetical protein N44_04627 [Microcystis aeruginosa NIES-44]|uniref:Uncharacterized protein n=1 Tax=Microcystis aeruginosa NIES-44 TaxID=449439 RepID=A0A0A1VV47_MICAE|nr:hypothetical protein N44_02460 [Microcystis aeruginosa NIES-44]GAL95771.1 hypothetical protein N44_04627 [Microcystis aeruginosa NIES-44]
MRSTKAHAEVRTETGDGRQETGTPGQLSGIRFEFLVHCLLVTAKSFWLTGDGLDV